MKMKLLLASTALGPIIWGTTYIVTTELLPLDKPFLTAFIRAFPAGLILILLSRSWPLKKEWGKLFLLGVLNIGCFQAMLFVAAYRLPGGIAAIFSATQPLIVLFLVWWIDKVSPSYAALISYCLSIVGMAMLVMTPTTQLDHLGIAAALLGSLSMGIGTFLTKKWKHSLSIIGFTGWQLLFGSFILLPLTLFLELPLPELTINNLLGYTYLTIFGAIISYFLWFKGVEHLSAIAVSSLVLLSPLTAALLGWVFLGEKLTTISILGFTIVIASILIIQISLSRQHTRTT